MSVAADIKIMIQKKGVISKVGTYFKVPALMGNYGTDPGILWVSKLKTLGSES